MACKMLPTRGNFILSMLCPERLKHLERKVSVERFSLRSALGFQEMQH